jgi:hypothetical protein
MMQDVLDLARTERLVDDDGDTTYRHYPEERCCGLRAALEEEGDPVVRPQAQTAEVVPNGASKVSEPVVVDGSPPLQDGRMVVPLLRSPPQHQGD